MSLFVPEGVLVFPSPELVSFQYERSRMTKAIIPVVAGRNDAGHAIAPWSILDPGTDPNDARLPADQISYPNPINL